MAQESAVDHRRTSRNWFVEVQKNHGYVAMGIGIGRWRFLLSSTKMATNRAIFVGLVLAVVAYVGALRVLPSATATNYQV